MLFQIEKLRFNHIVEFHVIKKVCSLINYNLISTIQICYTSIQNIKRGKVVLNNKIKMVII